MHGKTESNADATLNEPLQPPPGLEKGHGFLHIEIRVTTCSESFQLTSAAVHVMMMMSNNHDLSSRGFLAITRSVLIYERVSFMIPFACLLSATDPALLTLASWRITQSSTTLNTQKPMITINNNNK